MMIEHLSWYGCWNFSFVVDSTWNHPRHVVIINSLTLWLLQHLTEKHIYNLLFSTSIRTAISLDITNRCSMSWKGTLHDACYIRCHLSLNKVQMSNRNFMAGVLDASVVLLFDFISYYQNIATHNTARNKLSYIILASKTFPKSGTRLIGR